MIGNESRQDGNPAELRRAPDVADRDSVDAVYFGADSGDAWSTHGISMTKRVLWSSPECGSLAAAIDLEDRNQMLVRMTTKNFEESMAARSEGRKPEFKD